MSEVKVRYWRRLRNGWAETAKLGPWHALPKGEPFWNMTAVCGVSTYRASNYGAQNSPEGDRPEGRLCPKCVKALS